MPYWTCKGCSQRFYSAADGRWVRCPSCSAELLRLSDEEGASSARPPKLRLVEDEPPASQPLSRCD